MPLSDLLGVLLVRLLLACADAFEHWLGERLIGDDDDASDIPTSAEQLRQCAQCVQRRIQHPEAKKKLDHQG